MIKLYKSQVKTYLMVLISTMLLCTIFILTAHHSDGTEQTYEMTDHKVTENIKQDNAKAQSTYKDSEQSEHQVTPLIAAVN
ncbi:hypothetical protein BUZ14_10090 [Staphylococcus gallinarum]|uniref:Uncharacterized protein n=1 Tax=Staphylococcus gallinarum TaxID=1293 RepID=A0A3A0VME0_STAGA|nr:DNA damage-induced cell division inhibitor SosA [Staphylococcus gallinarum]RIP33452.1 hypothetical protein BUZ14_10090 [Staphylococcus gallinarum]